MLRARLLGIASVVLAALVAPTQLLAQGADSGEAGAPLIAPGATDDSPGSAGTDPPAAEDPAPGAAAASATAAPPTAAPTATPSSARSRAAKSVAIIDFAFKPASITIDAGDT